MPQIGQLPGRTAHHGRVHRADILGSRGGPRRGRRDGEIRIGIGLDLGDTRVTADEDGTVATGDFQRRSHLGASTRD